MSGSLAEDRLILRDAATRLRERADRALGDATRWFVDADGFGDAALWAHSDATPDRPMPVLYGYDVIDTGGASAFDLLATMTPQVALLIAAVLQTAAATPAPPTKAELALARAISGLPRRPTEGALTA